ncbi:hypothetical protein GCM10028857_07630 [Salinarchaeum chitinilyticum]
MSDPLASLAELADAVERRVGDGSLDSERAVQLRAVEPLLEILGWDVRGPEVVPETDLSGQTVEYLLQIESRPSVAVRTVSPGSIPTDDVLSRFEAALSESHAPRGVVTDGRTIVLLLKDNGEIHRRSLPFTALANHADALGRFHRSVLAETATSSRADRRRAARRLDEERAALVDAVSEELVSVTGKEFEAAVLEESTRAIDALRERLGPDDESADSIEQEPAEPKESVGPEASGEQVEQLERGEQGEQREPTGSEEPENDDEDSTPTTSDQLGTSAEPDSTQKSVVRADGSEYVVRFFGGASSVGAVGTQSPGGTVVGAVRYLLENHDLGASLTLPWQLSSGTTVLAKSAESADWTTLENAAGDAVAVRSLDDPALAKTAIEELAEATGLRVMYQGDW